VSAFTTLLDVDDEVGVFVIVGFVVVVGEVVIDVGDVDVLLEIAGVVVNLFDKFLTTLFNGLRSIPFALGNCSFEVRFFRIAMSYPVFFTNEVRPAILLTGLNFASLGKVLGGIAPAF